jgi:hypothetical protein
VYLGVYNIKQFWQSLKSSKDKFEQKENTVFEQKAPKWEKCESVPDRLSRLDKVKQAWFEFMFWKVQEERGSILQNL